ncbi:hypothetical protein [Jeongeupia sp. USM3]|uniref:hypothetical protein n=1 Tax=Jeongeupia sp. USM3 TaxID=1906741 RepID=UPI00089DDB92|nr:hypothetical protein [Jeongeupia sp. USM3]AOY02026.1 hypothetical protein BJP62_17225 [Jeongeupia sp. USM3]
MKQDADIGDEEILAEFTLPMTLPARKGATLITFGAGGVLFLGLGALLLWDMQDDGMPWLVRLGGYVLLLLGAAFLCGLLGILFKPRYFDLHITEQSISYGLRRKTQTWASMVDPTPGCIQNVCGLLFHIEGKRGQRILPLGLYSAEPEILAASLALLHGFLTGQIPAERLPD